MTNYQKAAAFLQEKMNGAYDTCVVLGSGYGNLIDKLPNKMTISYSEIPGFPVSTVPGHRGEMVFSELNGKKVIFMSGRFHFYEGYSMSEVTFYVRVLKLLGVTNLILTNATGGINPDFRAKTISPRCPGTVETGKPGISLYDIVILFGNLSIKLPYPEPNTTQVS